MVHFSSSSNLATAENSPSAQVLPCVCFSGISLQLLQKIVQHFIAYIRCTLEIKTSMCSSRMRTTRFLTYAVVSLPGGGLYYLAGVCLTWVVCGRAPSRQTPLHASMQTPSMQTYHPSRQTTSMQTPRKADPILADSLKQTPSIQIPFRQTSFQSDPSHHPGVCSFC